MTRERIDYFLQLLGQLRVTSRPEEFPSISAGYRTEVERMQTDVLDYLSHHARKRVE